MKRSQHLVGLLAAGLLVLAACGSDDKTATTNAPGTSGSSGTEAPGTEAPGTDVPGTDVPGTDGSTGGFDPSLPAVTVGFHNLEGGSYSLPDLRVGFEAGVKYINEELGGINGHELKVDECQTDMVPETSVNCANQLVDDGVVLGVQGIDYTFDAGLPILQDAGILDIGGFAYGPATNVAVGDFYAHTYASEEGYAAGLVMLKSIGSTKITEILPNVPSTQAAAADVIAPTADKLGLDVTPVFYDQPADWATIAATVVTSNPDAVNLFAVEPDCLAAIPALRSAGFTGPIVAGVCVQPLTELDPALLENVYIGATYYSPQMTEIPAKAQADLDIFNRYVDVSKLDQFQAMQGWATALFAASILQQVPGEITAESVHDAAKTATGDLAFRTWTYDCSKPAWPDTTTCATGFLYGKATSDRKIELLPDMPVDISGLVSAG